MQVIESRYESKYESRYDELFGEKEAKPFTVLNELETSYYQEGEEYIPVTLKDITTGPFCGRDLYLRSVVNKHDQYVLYIKGANLLIDDKKEELIRRNIDNLFIQKNGADGYIHFIEANLKDIIIDTEEDKDIKAKIAYEVGMNMVQELLSAPKVKDNDMVRANDWVFLMVNLFLENNYVYSNLAKILGNDKNVFRHCVNVAVTGLLFAKHTRLEISLMKELGIGLLLHDIGLIRLSLANGISTLGENATYDIENDHDHPKRSYSILSECNKFKPETLDMVLQHHENIDGSGYPQMLKGDDIQLLSRYARIVDEYDTLMNHYGENSFVDRHFNALTRMISVSKCKFDKRLLTEFVKFLATKHGDRSILKEFVC